MTQVMSPVPDTASLKAGLAAVFSAHSRPDAVEILTRGRNIQTSTFPSEIISCRFDGRELRLFCKYSDPLVNHVHGHRSGVGLEAVIYRDVLAPLPLTTPRYHGHFQADDGRTYLFLEALDAIARLSKEPSEIGMPAAARWIGRFHALNAGRASQFSQLLHKYSQSYLENWVWRTSDFAGDWHSEFPWLARLCKHAAQHAPAGLLDSDTIIHGEYYPKNILVYGGEIYPVDWESAAVAIGEIDFASLTEKWPQEIVEMCREEYVQARWNGTPPPDFDQKLLGAKLYLHFRWLGNLAEWTAEPKVRWRFEQMKELGERLGLL